MLAFNLRHRWLTPIVGLGVLASTWYPFQNIDKDFGTSRAEMFVQVRVQFTEEVSLDRKQEIISAIEAELEPHREALNARAIYAFWSDRWSQLRLYPPEGETDEARWPRCARRCAVCCPRFPGCG